MEYRIEEDSIGTREIPIDAYYGVQSLRGYENFKISGLRLRGELIESLAQIKKACALCNHSVGQLDDVRCEAICSACDEIIAGKWHDQFLCDPIQGGAGTSANMNANEVIANRAIELLGGHKGDYSVVHPNDHVNRGQSTNDVIPTAARMTTIRLIDRLLTELASLAQALKEKSEEFQDVIKMGRTQMQDAVPIRLGDEFAAYVKALERDRARLCFAREEMRFVNLGGTAIGTCLNADPKYVEMLPKKLAEISSLPIVACEDRIDGTQNLDSFVLVSSALKTLSVTLTKMASDLRLMSSGPRCGFGEIHLPAKQNGSSIMPGKVNPVIPEVLSQVAFCVMGNDSTITLAAQAGQLELNFAEPVLYHKLFESLVFLTGAINTFTKNCVVGIEADRERCRELVERSVGVITALCPKLGYQNAAAIAKEAIRTGKSVRDVLEERRLFSKSRIEELLDPKSMV